MSHLISSASDEALQALTSQGILVSRPQVEEIISSLLGYPSFAALISEHDKRSDEPGLDEAEVLVLDHPSADAKAAVVLPTMSSSAIFQVVVACAQAIAECSGVTVFDDVDELFNSWVSGELAMIIPHSEEVDPALLESMGPVEVADEWTANESLWASDTEWTIEAKAEMREADAAPGQQAVLDCVGYMKFRKAGRAGLLVHEGGASCALRAS